MKSFTPNQRHSLRTFKSLKHISPMRNLNELQHKDKSYYTISCLATRQVCLVANKCSVHTEEVCLAFHEIAKSTHTSARDFYITWLPCVSGLTAALSLVCHHTVQLACPLGQQKKPRCGIAQQEAQPRRSWQIFPQPCTYTVFITCGLEPLNDLVRWPKTMCGWFFFFFYCRGNLCAS